AGSTHVLAPPYRFDGQRPPVRLAPPVLGAQTEKVLQEMLKLDRHALAQLREQGVI
ncbi:MAG: CoA transferase, partial [Quisquiliibacterium sp.]